MAASDSEKDPAESASEESEADERAAEADDGESDADAIDKALADEESATDEDDGEAEEASAKSNGKGESKAAEDADEGDEEESVESKQSGAKGGNSGRAPAKLPGVDMETGPPPATKKAAGSKPSKPSKPSRPIVTSGILDMRKLAAAYERELGAAAATKVDADEEPPMLGSADLSGPQVMLPTAEPTGSDNRAMLMVLGAIVAVVLIGITAVVTVLMVRHFSKDEEKPAVAENKMVAGEPAAQTPDQPATPAAGGDQGAGDVDQPAAGGDQTEPGDEPGDEPADKPEDKPHHSDKPNHTEKQPAPTTDKHHTSTDTPKDTTPKDTTPKDTTPKDTTPKDTPKDTGSNDKCDEYVCLIEPDKPCCKKLAANSGGNKPKETAPELPERPSASDIQKGFSTLRPKLQGCADKNDFRGTANVKLRISADGSVSSATTDAGTGVFQTCISNQAKRVTFSKSQKGTSATFALVSR